MGASDAGGTHGERIPWNTYGDAPASHPAIHVDRETTRLASLTESEVAESELSMGWHVHDTQSIHKPK